MKKLKKTLSTLLICMFIFTNFGLSVNAEKSEVKSYIKEIIIYKHNLGKIKNGDKYIKQIDKIVYSLDNNKLKLLEVRVEKAIRSLSGKTDIKSTHTLFLLKYLNSKIKYSLFLTYEKEKSEEEILKDFNETSLSEEEKQKVEDKIVDLQLNLFNQGKNIIEKFTDDFEKLSNYKDTGNFKLDLDINQEIIGTINSELNLSDYTAISSNFDSQIKGQLDGLLNTSIKGENESVQFSSLIDFISKDGNMYLLLQDLNIVNESELKDLKIYVEELKKLASQNKYIKFENKEAKQVLNTIKNLPPNKLISEGEKLFSQPLFEAYKKDGDKYLLKPTKYACDEFKKLTNKFDPFYGDSCSNGQYNDLLKELAEWGEVYLMIGDENQIGFTTKQYDTEINAYIIYDDNSIQDVFATIIPNQDKHLNEGFELNYKSKDGLNINLYADSGEIDYKLESKLDENNKFTYINFKGHTINKYENLAIILNLANNKISGAYEINSINSDGELISEISGNISGATTNQNKLTSLNIDLIGKDINGEFEYNNKTFVLITDYISEMDKFNLNIGGIWDGENRVFRNFDYDVAYLKKPRTYNYDTYKYEYSSDFEEVFNSNLTLKNSLLSGKTIINYGGEEFININHSGNYEKNYLDFKNIFTVKDIIQLSENDYNGNLNISTDLRNNKQNSKLHLELNQSDKQVIKFDLENIASREYKQIEIKTPINTVDGAEVFSGK